MAGRDSALGPAAALSVVRHNGALLAGGLVALCLWGMAGGAVGALLLADSGGFTHLYRKGLDGEGPYIMRVAGFTLWQAALSTLLSLGLAIPVARALHRRRFPGRTAVIRLLGLCFIMPAIAVILGLVTVHGGNGWVNRLAQAAGFSGGPYLYGLTGILLAHVFFNMPLATRGLLHALQGIPGEQWRLAAQMRLGEQACFRLVEWPALRRALPGLAGLVFMLCFTSFVVVLALGGGPGATTLEVAVYTALRFDFDLSAAAWLALAQTALCGVCVGLLLRFTDQPIPGELSAGIACRPATGSGMAALLQDMLALAAAALLLLPPLAAILLAGVTPAFRQLLAAPEVWSALGASLAVALPAGILALLTGMSLLAASRSLTLDGHSPRLAALLEQSGGLILVFPPFVLAAGLFILLRNSADIFAIGPVLVCVINACMALPLMIRVIGPAYHQAGRERRRLCHSLGLGGLARFRLADWPVVRRPMALALALGCCLSLGDFGVIALFGSQNFTTLPLFIHRNMSAYRMDSAAAAVLLLTACCGLLLALGQLLAGRNRHA